MSTVTQPGFPRGPQEPEDPFRYGWRYQKTVGPDGSERFKKIPLTLEDVHHPQEEDFIMQRGGHNEDCHYLYDVLKEHMGDAALVTCDLRISWDTPAVEPLGPDVAVIFGGVFDRNRGTFDCAAEGLRPAVVFEVTSPSTRVNDVGPKVQEYYQAGVDWYVIIDALAFRGGQWVLRLLGYRRGESEYVSIALDERGWLWVEPLRIFVAVRDGRVVCYNEASVELLDYQDLSAAKTQVEQERDGERQQRELQREAERLQREATERERDAERLQREAIERERDAERQQREAAEREREAERLRREAVEQQREAERLQREAERLQREAAERQRDLAEHQREAERLQHEAAAEQRLQQLEEELRRLRGA